LWSDPPAGGGFFEKKTEPRWRRGYCDSFKLKEPDSSISKPDGSATLLWMGKAHFTTHVFALARLEYQIFIMQFRRGEKGRGNLGTEVTRLSVPKRRPRPAEVPFRKQTLTESFYFPITRPTGAA